MPIYALLVRAYQLLFFHVVLVSWDTRQFMADVSETPILCARRLGDFLGECSVLAPI
jgi:hypothetical protein